MGDAAKGGGELKGYLRKKARSGKWQKRWFEANDHYLTFYKDSTSDKLLACIDLYQTGNISLVEEVAVEGPSATEFSIEIMHKYYIIKAPSRDAAKIWVEGLKSRQSTSSPDPAAAGMAEGRMDYISGLKGNSTAEQLLTAAALTKASAMSTKYNEDEKGVYNCCGCLVW